MSIARRVAKNSTYLITSEIIVKILQFVFIIVVARQLGDVQFGKFNFALSFAWILVILADFGLNTLAIREISINKNQVNKFISNILILEITFTIILTAAIAVLLKIFHSSPERYLVVMLISASIFVNNIAQLYKNVFQAFEQMQYEAIIKVIYTLSYVLVSIFIISKGYGLVPLCIIYFITSLFNLGLSSILCYSKIAKPLFSADLKVIKKLLNKSWPFVLTAILISVYFNIDVIMLTYMLGDKVTGIYSAAYKIMSSLLFISMLFGMVMFPVFSRLYQKKSKDLFFALSKSIKYMFLIAFPIAIGVTMLSDKIIILLFGYGFIDAHTSLKILIWAMFFIFINNMLTYFAYGAKKEKIITIFGLILVSFNIILNIYLIPLYSHMGASIATALTEFFNTILSMSLAYFVLKKNFINISSIKTIFPGIIMAISLIFTKSFALYEVIPLSIIIYVVLVFLFRILDEKDFELLKQIIKKPL